MTPSADCPRWKELVKAKKVRKNPRLLLWQVYVLTLAQRRGLGWTSLDRSLISLRTHIGLSLQSNVYKFVRRLDSVMRDMSSSETRRRGQNSGSSLLGRKKPDLSRRYVVEFVKGDNRPESWRHIMHAYVFLFAHDPFG